MVFDISSNTTDGELPSVFEVQSYFNSSQSKSRVFSSVDRS
jgi:hypothetical protein